MIDNHGIDQEEAKGSAEHEAQYPICCDFCPKAATTTNPAGNPMCTRCAEEIMSTPVEGPTATMPPWAYALTIAIILALLGLLALLSSAFGKTEIPMLSPARRADVHHSEVSINLPDSGQVLDSDYMAGLMTDRPRGLIVNLDDRHQVTLPVKLWGWSDIKDNESADINHDGFVNGIDWDMFMQAFNAGSEGADFNGDGFVTGEDYDEFARVFVGSAR